MINGEKKEKKRKKRKQQPAKQASISHLLSSFQLQNELLALDQNLHRVVSTRAVCEFAADGSPRLHGCWRGNWGVSTITRRRHFSSIYSKFVNLPPSFLAEKQSLPGNNNPLSLSPSKYDQIESFCGLNIQRADTLRWLYGAAHSAEW